MDGMSIIDDLIAADLERDEAGLPPPDAINLRADEFDALIAEFEDALVVKRKLPPSDSFFFCGLMYRRVPPDAELASYTHLS